MYERYYFTNIQLKVINLLKASNQQTNKMFSNINNTNTNDFSIEIESLYIAHVFPNIHKKKIAQLFEKLFLARIKGIDLVPKIGKDGKPYNSAYVHIDYWLDTSSAKHFQEKIRSDAKEALLVYDDPWYWIVNENISPEKSKFIEKAEEEKFEESQKQSSVVFREMQMMLDNLEKLCAENRRELNVLKQENNFGGFTEEEEYQILKELRFQERDEEYELEQQNNYYGRG
jgi:hypothetical protein